MLTLELFVIGFRASFSPVSTAACQLSDSLVHYHTIAILFLMSVVQIIRTCRIKINRALLSENNISPLFVALLRDGAAHFLVYVSFFSLIVPLIFTNVVLP